MLSEYPVLMNDPIIHRWPWKGFLSYRTEPNLPRHTLSFNQSAIEILARCDGTRSVGRIAEELSELYQADYDDVAHKVRVFLKDMEDKIPLVFKKEPHPVPLRVTGSREYVVPMHVALELTYSCNLYCRHCYAMSSSAHKYMMPLEKVLEVFEKISAWGVRVIELTGGEPTIHPKFPEILEASLRYFDLTGIITNGLRVTPRMVEVLKKAPQRFMVQIDLDGSSEEYVDWFRGKKGTFRKEIEAIQKVTELGVLVRVAMIVTPQNLDQVEKTAELAKRLGAASFGVSPVVPQGRAQDESLLLSPSEYEQFLEIWEDLKRKHPHFVFQLEEFSHQTSQGNCGAGSRTVSITPYGDIKICQMSSTDILHYGNVFEHDMSQIFGKPVVSYIAQVTPPGPDVCGDCEYLGFCINCIHRGITKGREIGVDKCKWLSKHRDMFYTPSLPYLTLPKKEMVV
ncbi:MAG: radical SAM protein [Chloroflexi bacterium]|nr:radical SAM protein [Chloroflexota bacterium]